MKTYITFGQSHTHNILGVHFHKDVVAVINHDTPGYGDKITFEYLDGIFHQHIEDEIPPMEYFPGGLVTFPIKQEMYHPPIINEPLEIIIKHAKDEDELFFNVASTYFKEDEYGVTENMAKRELIAGLKKDYNFLKSLPFRYVKLFSNNERYVALERLFG